MLEVVKSLNQNYNNSKWRSLRSHPRDQIVNNLDPGPRFPPTKLKSDK